MVQTAFGGLFDADTGTTAEKIQNIQRMLQMPRWLSSVNYYCPTDATVGAPLHFVFLYCFYFFCLLSSVFSVDCFVFKHSSFVSIQLVLFANYSFSDNLIRAERRWHVHHAHAHHTHCSFAKFFFFMINGIFHFVFSVIKFITAFSSSCNISLPLPTSNTHTLSLLKI